ncbi:MAG TPA: hypothetical protein EYP80_00520 [Candidatus Aenigmarchaeota archaeon]|nr:hypothetical protein [Candidatus Aenigmarchaeota archaeon]
MITLKNPQEAAQFIKDLISPQELEMLAKRLRVAKLLLRGVKYQTIRKTLKVGNSTLARISTWLSVSGEGFRLVHNRTKDRNISRIKSQKEKVVDYFSWQSIKRRYPQYFWPELLLKEIVKSANQREKERLRKILQTLQKSNIKSKLYKQLNRLL